MIPSPLESGSDLAVAAVETADKQAPLVDWLGGPDAYPHRTQHVEHIQTHISHVFLAGPRVYKLKKPVKYDFLDFEALAAREFACREEVRLNRRLAPDAYLGVVPIVRTAGGDFCLGGEGQVVDWLVEMRRLQTNQSLLALVQRNELRPEHIDRLADTLIRFYRSLPPAQLTADEYLRRYLSHVQGNRRELLAISHHLPRDQVQRVHGFQLQLLRLAPELLAERVRSGRIVDGHGDLRPEHICLSEPVAIFDCIEFNAEYRTIDVADELAFLASECDFAGADWAGLQVRTAWQRESGDVPPEVLWAFYKSYRACVRAKVAALRADQLSGDEQSAAAAEAKRHLALADQDAAPWIEPLVLAVGGLSGTGKTTLATAVAEALGAELLRTDVVRQDLFGSGSHAAALDSGIYRPEAREQVYQELFRRAAALNGRQISAVLDGTFSMQAQVAAAQAVASHPKARFLAIECVCRPEVAQERISRRLAAGADASEARPEVHDKQRQRWETWPAGIPQVRINTEQPLQQQVDQVIADLRPLPG